MVFSPEGSPLSERRDKQTKLDYLTEIIKNGELGGIRLFDYELKLQEMGLLAHLMQIGIIPDLESPNPFDPELEAKENHQWWDNHPAEMENYVKASENREQALRLLYIGTILSQLFTSSDK